MTGGSTIRWHLANYFGIWRGNGWGDADFVESAADAWNSGHVNDVLVHEGGLLGASDTGGVWILSAEGNPSLCLSDSWEHSIFRSLAQGITPQQVFAGGEALYVTDVAATVPLLTWVHIASLPPKTGMIHRVLVLPEIGRIVLACDGGILWSPIPAPPGMTYTWQRAEVEGVTSGGYYDVAPGVQHKIPAHPGHPQGRITQDIIAGGTGGLPVGRVTTGATGGPVTAPADSSAGIFAGTWEDDGVLRLRRSAIFIGGSRADGEQQKFGAVSVASCPGQRSRAYACCSLMVKNDSPHLYGILRSDDGGRTWTPCADRVDMLTDKTLAELAGHQGNYNNVIAVSHWQPDIVAFGFNNTFLSFNGGVSWTPIGIDDKGHYLTPRHLHADIHGLTFTDPFPDAPQDLLVASDGGVAAVNWSQSPWIVEDRRVPGGNHGSLEAVVLEGNTLVHYSRPADQPLEPFQRKSEVTYAATGGGCLIVSSRWTGGPPQYDLVVLEDTSLVHYWTDNSTSPPEWNRAAVITSQATGPGCMIESNYYTGDLPNFEVVALEGSNLIHYWHDGADRNTPWHRTPTPITTHAASAACFIQSEFPFDSEHGNFELVVLEDAGGALGSALVHYARDNGYPYPWSAPTLITRNATAQGCIFQTIGGDDRHGDFQVIVQEARNLSHWVRDNSNTAYLWHYVGSILGQFVRASGPGCAFQGSYGADPGNGNFELAACVEGAVEHRYRDTASPSMPWPGKQVISRGGFTGRSLYNRQLPNLQFYGPVAQPLGTFSVSRLIPGLAAGGTQDNGVLYSTSEHHGAVPAITPWFEPEGGDGGPVAFLPAHSWDGPLVAAGRVLVECNNQEDAGKPVGAKSRRWDNASRRLIGYPDPAKPVIPLNTVSPHASPAPDPAHGLVDPYLEAVTEPRYRRRGAYMCAVGATGGDVYGLFLDDAANEGDFAPPRRWEYIGTVLGSDGKPQEITALASQDGMTILVSAFTLGTGSVILGAKGWIYRMDSNTGNTSLEAVDAALGAPSLSDIAMISSLEAYGITDSDTVIRWDGGRWQATGAFPAGTGLVAITADLSHNPPVLFVAATNRVFVSTDRGATWRAASTGLPAAVQCSDIDWVTDANGSRVYLSTYGRSAWMALQTED